MMITFFGHFGDSKPRSKQPRDALRPYVVAATFFGAELLGLKSFTGSKRINCWKKFRWIPGGG